MTFELPACSACGKAVFPPRALCPRCGSRDWGATGAGAARVLVVTERDGVRIAAVETEPGPIVIARLEGDGEGIVLENDGGTAIARAR